MLFYFDITRSPFSSFAELGTTWDHCINILFVVVSAGYTRSRLLSFFRGKSGNFISMADSDGTQGAIVFEMKNVKTAELVPIQCAMIEKYDSSTTFRQIPKGITKPKAN